ncbi:hypothetical protein [Streptomyces europaeiscabiei]|uniref:hypothetical protein n=1 Tax=Streptomyces europaeiscabiei TaxID=146819 RepID=UPI0038F80097
MPRTTTPSPADQQLIDHAQRHGFTVSAKQLETWRRAGLLPANASSSLGRGRGSTSRAAPEAFELVVALARLAARGRRPGDLALLLFAERLPVPEATVRAALTASVDRVVLSVEEQPDQEGDDATAGGQHEDAEQDMEEHAQRTADRAVAAGLAITLVPARARRIDERIARRLRDAGVEWPPPELADLDRTPDPAPLSLNEATTAAVTTTLRGGAAVTPQGLGDFYRALQPGMANPIASLVEYTVQDAPDAAASIFGPDGGFALVPEGDIRDTFRLLADTTPLGDLHAAWQAAQAVRDWALDLCERVEADLDTAAIGDAVSEWVHIRWFPSGLHLLEALRDRRWSPADHANSTLLLLLMRQALGSLDEQVPGWQRELMTHPGLIPPPLQGLFTGRNRTQREAGERFVASTDEVERAGGAVADQW